MSVVRVKVSIVKIEIDNRRTKTSILFSKSI
jgi:predicted aspartyl protease